VACPHAGETAAEVPGCQGRPVLWAVQFTLDARPAGSAVVSVSASTGFGTRSRVVVSAPPALCGSSRARMWCRVRPRCFPRTRSGRRGRRASAARSPLSAP
jgi:hypothetical protein